MFVDDERTNCFARVRTRKAERYRATRDREPGQQVLMSEALSETKGNAN